MKHAAAALLLITAVAGSNFSADMKDCSPAAFARLKLTGTTVRSAARVAAGAFTPPGGRGSFSDLTGFCRVQASTTSGKGSRIDFEVWIPGKWNGKIVATGNPGYSNLPSYRDMAYALSEGYAASGGDTGHQTPTADDLLWGVGHPERILDWGTRSIHTIAGPAQRIVQALTGASPKRAYYYGCSTGGHQGYAEIQRYPNDFDGVIAGAPGNNRVRLNVGFLWQFRANHRRGDPEHPIIPALKLPVVTNAIVAACDAKDGVVDSVVEDPRSCSFDPASLQCKAADEPTCLTEEQVSALRKMYAGAANPRTHAQLYPGWPKSSEALTTLPTGAPGAGWHLYWGTTEPARVNFWRYWVFNNPRWDPWSFDFDRGVTHADAKVGGLIDQVSPDITAFRRHGGKAIVYQGWQDPVVNAIDTIAYYEKVRGRVGSQQAADRFFRLFLVAGMAHCGNGPGTVNFGNQSSPSPIIDARHDLLAALDAWVEHDTAPERIVASRVVNGATVRTRPLCPYPRKAVYVGTGSTDDAESFVCRQP